MATAAKLAIDEDSHSVAELLAGFTGTELLAAAGETSRIYNGQVLAKAVVLTQVRLRCFSLSALGKRLGIGHVTIYRWAKGMPTSERALFHAIADLASLLE